MYSNVYSACLWRTSGFVLMPSPPSDVFSHTAFISQFVVALVPFGPRSLHSLSLFLSECAVCNFVLL